ncbi:MAG: FMN-binding protein [Actinomycetota bacterium]|nr:FMN-binding protein [Actinomycetota bacterium]
MRRVVLALAGTVTGLVMLLSFKTHSASSSGALPAATAGSNPTTAHTTSSGAAGASGAKTVTGDSVGTRWGPVQVKITVNGGKITSAQAVVFPQGNSRDQEINSYAVPTLNQEAVAAGSANIDMVSGATYTSQGYIASLQSALDTARA